MGNRTIHGPPNDDITTDIIGGIVISIVVASLLEVPSRKKKVR